MAEATGTTYTKKIDGKVYEREAFTAADHVELEFSGWVKKSDAKPSPASTSSNDTKTK